MGNTHKGTFPFTCHRHPQHPASCTALATLPGVRFRVFAMDDDQRDPATGLLHRQAFLKVVHEAQASTPTRLLRGCLLILHFPVLQSLVAEGDAGEQAADDALRHLLAILETRIRNRDTLGRISRHSLCILLKGCREPDAVIVADQYVALLRDVVVQSGEQPLLMDLRYRIVPLDARGSKPRQGVSRMVIAPALPDHARLSKQIEVAGNRVDLTSSKVVSLNAARAERQAAAETSEQARLRQSGTVTVLDVGARDSAQSWRLRPGMLIQRKPLTCCFRLQSMGVVRTDERLRHMDLFASMLASLALDKQQTRPVIESQLILQVQANQIDLQFPQWVAARCKQMRVSPSDICLSLSVESLSKDLRSVSPILRQLNRHGIRLMLEGVATSSQFRMMKNIAHFDYLHVSGRAINDSLTKLAERMELEAIIADAREHDCEICSGGIDTQAMLAHALAMNIEIGFGRECGASIAFPEKAWLRAESLD